MGRHIVRAAGILNAGKAHPWLAVLAILTAISAMAIPRSATQVTEIATVLAVGGLALLAGHRWGLLVVATADVMLLGKLWPLLVFRELEVGRAVFAAQVALIGALPGLLLTIRTLPSTFDLVAGPQSLRLRTNGLRMCFGAMAMWLVLPVF